MAQLKCMHQYDFAGVWLNFRKNPLKHKILRDN